MKKALIRKIEYKLLFKYEFGWWDVKDYIDNLSNCSVFRVIKDFVMLKKSVKDFQRGM